MVLSRAIKKMESINETMAVTSLIHVGYQAPFPLFILSKFHCAITRVSENFWVYFASLQARDLAILNTSPRVVFCLFVSDCLDGVLSWLETGRVNL